MGYVMSPKLTEEKKDVTKTAAENNNKMLVNSCNTNEWPKWAIDVKEHITHNAIYKHSDIPSDSLFRMPRKFAEEKEDRTKRYVKKNNKRLANNCNSSKWPRWAVNLKESIAHDKLYKHGDIPSNSFFPMPRKLVKRKDRTKTNVEERNK